MSTALNRPGDTVALRPAPNYLTNGYGLKSWLLTIDHKRIAILYLISITAMFFLGGIFALLIRLELLTPAGDLMEAEMYNRMFTMHGIVMIFFFLIPSIPAVLGNFLVPMMIGARDLAFPRLNLLSWYIYVVGGIFTLSAVVFGGVDTGWTFYTPFSTMYSNSNVALTAIGVFITGFSSILTGLNFIVTIHKMRAPGMTWFRLPLFIWSHYATSLIMVLGTPVLAITLVLVAGERLFHIGVFDPQLGGDPLLFQHLFWFYSHPAVYIMILPAMGVVSELVAVLLPEEDFRLHLRGVLQPGDRRLRFSGLGPPHVRERAVGLRRLAVLGPEFSGRDPFGDQGLQLDARRCTRDRFPTRPRCFMRSGSSDCSRSAG